MHPSMIIEKPRADFDIFQAIYQLYHICIRHFTSHIEIIFKNGVGPEIFIIIAMHICSCGWKRCASRKSYHGFNYMIENLNSISVSEHKDKFNNAYKDLWKNNNKNSYWDWNIINIKSVEISCNNPLS